MYYYSHHIGDFNNATRHLTRIERSVYRDLLELYYETEQPLALDHAALCRKIIARSSEEITAVEQVLNEFFTETSTGWFHNRCEEEIETFKNTVSAKSAAGRASAEKRRQEKEEKLAKLNNETANTQQDSSTCSTGVQQSLNECTTDEQLTSNHKPLTINQSLKDKAPEKSGSVAKPKGITAADLGKMGIDEQVAKEFIALRTRKRSNLTEIALAGIQREATKAGWTLEAALRKAVERGWQSFEADWLKGATGNKPSAHTGFAKQDYHKGVAADGTF